ncbi:hypothetical protein STEG23_027006 [Scotinomys teguina]
MEGMNCLNGGIWDGRVCLCPNGFTGERCENRVPVVTCQNGGTWDGLKCQCTSLFQGPRCEEVVESIEIEQTTISASVEVTVTVTSQEYSEELQNKESEQYKKFNETFTEQMAMIYAGIPEYDGVVIKELRKGSIVVDYDVILKANYTEGYESVLEDISNNVEEKIKTATQNQVLFNNSCTGFMLCFNSTATSVQNLSVTENPEEECKKKAGDFANYVSLEYKNNKLHCITPCSTGYKASLDCHYGKCQLQRSGPQCLCLTTDTHWYSGETCDWGIQKSLVYGLGGAGVAVLLAILVILSVFSFRLRREARRQRSRVSQLQRWSEEEGRTPGAFHNVGFDHNEGREDYVHLGSMYSNFEASLSHINPERKIQIQRPQVVMTSL